MDTFSKLVDSGLSDVMNTFSEQSSLPSSAEPQNLTQNNDSNFADFSDIKSLLDDMVNIVDANENKENNTLPNANASANPIEEPYYRHFDVFVIDAQKTCLLYTSPSPRDKRQSRMPSSA